MTGIIRTVSIDIVFMMSSVPRMLKALLRKLSRGGLVRNVAQLTADIMSRCTGVWVGLLVVVDTLIGKFRSVFMF